MANIHPTATIEKGAQIAEGAIIGPYCHVSSMAKIGTGTELLPHVVVEGNCSIGEHCRISSFAVLGGRTQDLKYKGGNPGVKIGNHTTIREYVTVNSATNDGDYTTVGDHCLLMAYTHIAHCCKVGNHVIIANACQIAGHVVIEDMATIEGLVGVVQFLRIGKLAFIGGVSKITKDIPPFMIATGNPAEVRGFNRIGMERRGLDENKRKLIKEAYRILYRQDKTPSHALREIEENLEQIEEVRHLLDFCKASEKGIAR